MHEVSLCHQLARAVTRATGTRRVAAVHVDVGQVRQVVPEAMQHAWGFVVRGTTLGDAELLLRIVPAVLACEDCGARRQLDRRYGFTCEDCGSARTRLVSGEEFVLTAVDVVDEPEDAGAASVSGAGPPVDRAAPAPT